MFLKLNWFFIKRTIYKDAATAATILAMSIQTDLIVPLLQPLLFQVPCRLLRLHSIVCFKVSQPLSSVSLISMIFIKEGISAEADRLVKR